MEENLSETTQDKILEIVAVGKAVAPYEKVTTFNSLDLVPENKSFLKINEFHSELKQSNVSDRI